MVCPCKIKGKPCESCLEKIAQAKIKMQEMFGEWIPKEIEIPTDVCGVKVTIAEAYGWNACVKEIRNRVKDGVK